MNDAKELTKIIYVRTSKEMWHFLKIHSFDLDESMNSIITRCLEKYKKQIESKNLKQG